MRKIIAGLTLILALSFTLTATSATVSSSSGTGWTWTIENDGTTLTRLTTEIPGSLKPWPAPIGSYLDAYAGQGAATTRNVPYWNIVGVINSDYKPFGFKYVVSAKVDLTFTYESDNAGLTPPGVHAYEISMTDKGGFGAAQSLPDYNAPVITDFGKVVPVGDGTGGQYSIDVTDQLQAALDDPAYGVYFMLRLHLGDETDGTPIDPGITELTHYFFDGAGQQSRFYWTLSDVPEPSTIAIGLSSLMTLWLLRRKK